MPSEAALARGSVALVLLVLTACGNDAPPPRHVPPPTPTNRSVLDASANVVPLGALPLVPKPRRLERCAGAFAIAPATPIVIDDVPEANSIAHRLATWLGPRPVELLPRGAPDPKHGIVVRVLEATKRDPALLPPANVEDESYTLDLDDEHVLIRARSAAGMFYGAQTLAQLAQSRLVGEKEGSAKTVPCVHIEDSPRYPVRAMHLDVARHFFDASTVERFVDLLAFYRFNVFHFHLTDDQGFRIEVDGHPELTQIGGKGGFYTRDVAKRIVAQAKERFITVVPEIEMPGHARAILVAHPELSCTGKKLDLDAAFGVVHEDVLCAGNEHTYALVDAILADVVKTFPSHLVHIGGDEVPKTRWKACPKCRAKMTQEKLTPEALQGAFMKHAAGTLARLGRRPAVWDEALEPSLPKDAIVFAWQGVDRTNAAIKAGHDVVVVPWNATYLNARQSMAVAEVVTREPAIEGFNPWTTVHAFDPGNDPHVLGGGGALWTERITTPEQIDTMAMPRLAALAEALWTGPPADPDFIDRFRQQRSVLDASAVRYFIEPPVGVANHTRVFLQGKEPQVVIEPPALFPDGTVRISDNGTLPTKDSPVFMPHALHAAKELSVALFLANGRSSPVLRARYKEEAPRMAYQGATFDGVKYTYYETAVHRLPKLDGLKPKKTGTLASITLDPSFRRNDYVVRYESFYFAEKDDVYRFKARADDGVRVLVDRELVLEDDGEHEARDAIGEIALGKGLHQVVVEYFQSGGGAELSLTIRPAS